MCTEGAFGCPPSSWICLANPSGEKQAAGSYSGFERRFWNYFLAFIGDSFGIRFAYRERFVKHAFLDVELAENRLQIQTFRKTMQDVWIIMYQPNKSYGTRNIDFWNRIPPSFPKIRCSFVRSPCPIACGIAIRPIGIHFWNPKLWLPAICDCIPVLFI